MATNHSIPTNSATKIEHPEHHENIIWLLQYQFQMLKSCAAKRHRNVRRNVRSRADPSHFEPIQRGSFIHAYGPIQKLFVHCTQCIQLMVFLYSNHMHKRPYRNNSGIGWFFGKQKTIGFGNDVSSIVLQLSPINWRMFKCSYHNISQV